MQEIDRQPQNSLIGEFAQSALYAGIQTPIDGITQLVNHTMDSEVLPSVQLIDAPQQTEFGSANWHAQQVGGAAGMLLPFLAVSKVTRGAMTKAGFSAESAMGARGLWNARTGLAIAESGISGFVYDAALKPVAPNEGNFWQARLKHGLTGAATFSTLTASSIGLRGLGTTAFAKATGTGALLRNEIAVGTMSGLPAGLVAAESGSLLIHGRHASAKELAQSAYTMSFAGGALSGMHQLAGQPTRHAEQLQKFNPTRVSTMMEAARGKLTGLGERVDNFMASINPLLINQPDFAIAGMSNSRGLGAADLVRSRQERPSPENNVLQMSSLKDKGDAADVLTTGSTGRSSGVGRLEVSAEGKLTESKGSGEKAEGAPEGDGSSGAGKRTRRDKSSEREREKERERERPEQLQSLQDALIYQGFENIAAFVAKNPKLRNQKVVRELGNGNDSPVVLELAPSAEFPEGGALKVTIPEGGFPKEWGHRSFDAKLLTKVYEMDAMQGSTASAYLYVQELVDVLPRYSPEQLNDFFTKVEAAGLEWTDPGSHPTKQVGVSRTTGELVLIDYPCVDKAGSNETLQAIIGGAERVEETWAREDNAKGPLEEDVPKYDQEKDLDVEQRRQDVLGKSTDKVQQEVLKQLIAGFEVKEIAEFIALTEGWTKADGMPDMSRALPVVKKIKANAEKQGLLEAEGKSRRFHDVDDAD